MQEIQYQIYIFATKYYRQNATPQHCLLQTDEDRLEIDSE